MYQKYDNLINIARETKSPEYLGNPPFWGLLCLYSVINQNKAIGIKLQFFHISVVQTHEEILSLCSGNNTKKYRTLKLWRE